MVRRFWVTSSPTVPSPLVAPCTNVPFSYVRFTAKPSIFSSHTRSNSASSIRFFERRYQASNSSRLKALPKLNMGCVCCTWVKPSDGASPTRWVGESVVISSGCCSSSWRSFRISRSYSPSVISGSSKA